MTGDLRFRKRQLRILTILPVDKRALVIFLH
jgi:hypothetical protein